MKVYHSQSGQTLLQGDSLEDLGDYLPTFLHANQSEQVDQEVTRALARLRDEQLPPDKVFSKWGLSGYRTYSLSDLWWGIYLAALYDSRYHAHLLEISDWVVQKYIEPQPIFMQLTYRLGKIEKPFLNIPVLASMDQGLFIELLAKTYRLAPTRKDLYARAVQLWQLFTDEDTFKKFGYFPFYAKAKPNLAATILLKTRLRRHQDEYQLLKQNSNLLFGLAALIEVAPEAEKPRWSKQYGEILNTWRKNYYDRTKKIFFTNYSHREGTVGSDLTVFHLIDLLSWSYRHLKNEDHLAWANEIADDWLKYQDQRTGLLPFLHPASTQQLKRFGVKPGATWLDSQVDFGVALLKLSASMNNTKYLPAVKKLWESIQKYHRQAHGYAASVQVETGAVLDYKYSLKMTALVNKLPMALTEFVHLRHDDSLVAQLLEDR